MFVWHLFDRIYEPNQRKITYKAKCLNVGSRWSVKASRQAVYFEFESKTQHC